MATVGDLRARHAEFAKTADGLIEQRLAEAARSIDAEVYGETYGDSQIALAAHFLATSPAGAPARLESSKGESTYLKTFLEYRRAAVFAIRVF